MSCFDLAVGISQTGCNDLLSQLYNNPPSGSNNPFSGDVTKSISGVGSVELIWEIEQPPTITFGSPALDAWNTALNANGQTNQDSKTPLPGGNMIQLCIPAMNAYYDLPNQPKVGGETKNVNGYATVNFSGSSITIALVALALNESDFTKWDKVIFNAVFIPQIFSVINSVLSVINIPSLSWQGITLNTPQFSFVNNNLLIAASTETSNTTPLNISSVTWPSNSLFILMSQQLIQSVLNTFSTYVLGLNLSGSGTYHNLGSDLADYQYNPGLTSIQPTWAPTASNAGTVTANIQASPTMGGSLTAAGMALAVTAGCALSSGQAGMQPGP